VRDSVCELVHIHGDVQGVCFRYYAKCEADGLGISGWVRNMPDGSVDALIRGSETKLVTMRKWLSQGPPMARVLDFCVEPCPEDSCPKEGFHIIDFVNR